MGREVAGGAKIQACHLKPDHTQLRSLFPSLSYLLWVVIQLKHFLITEAHANYRSEYLLLEFFLIPQAVTWRWNGKCAKAQRSETLQESEQAQWCVREPGPKEGDKWLALGGERRVHYPAKGIRQSDGSGRRLGSVGLGEWLMVGI